MMTEVIICKYRCRNCGDIFTKKVTGLFAVMDHLISVETCVGNTSERGIGDLISYDMELLNSNGRFIYG